MPRYLEPDLLLFHKMQNKVGSENPVVFEENKPDKTTATSFYNLSIPLILKEFTGLFMKLTVESLSKSNWEYLRGRVIGSVSRLRHEKGIDLLIEAFKILVREGIIAHLLIVGSGPDEENLKNQAVFFGIH